LTVSLTSTAGKPASAAELKTLKKLTGKEYAVLEPLYREFNGLVLHRHGKTCGLVVGAVKYLAGYAEGMKGSFFGGDADLFPFQREGVPFATIEASGNYFVVHQGNVYYSDSDGGDDSVWGENLDAFFTRALADPVKFLDAAGSYTRYFDGKTDRQYIPETFLHD
jgi:hypothetical protein